MLEIAKKYHSVGLSVIPVDDKKIPLGPWAASQKSCIEPNGSFSNAYGIGIVCGAVSGNLEVIDIDCKYDLTSKLYENYIKLISDINPLLPQKLAIQTTSSSGYHLIYKCDEIAGNLKLAARSTTSDEQQLNPKQKTKVLIETRGEGGYFMCTPSKGYNLIQGKFSQIPTITIEERTTLFNCAKLLNEIIKEPKQPDIQEGETAFDDYNNNADVLKLLESNGWKVKSVRGSKYLLLRPGGEGMWSADYDSDKRLLYVFTTSSEFENDKAYNPVQMLTTLQFNGDYSESSKWLLKTGWGVKGNNKTPKINIDDDNYSFVASKEETGTYITQKRNGTFKMGNKTGFTEFDKYFRFKDSSLVMLLGHDNVGKSVVSWYLATLDALFNNESYIIFPGENKTGGVKFKIMEFYLCKSINKMSDDEFKKADDWFENHFTVINNNEMYTYTDMLTMGRKLLKKKKYGKFLIDPYNSLYKEAQNEHQYDYKAMLEFRLFIKQTGCCIYLNVHAATEALRRLYPKEHTHAGYTMPPKKADTEGGGKFPNKADDFLVIHRMPEHESEWMWTEIHVRKIKENETGGKQTFLNDPFKIKMIPGGHGFEDIRGQNPIEEYWRGPSKVVTFFNEPKTEFDNDNPF